jgi:hypothetical protein
MCRAGSNPLGMGGKLRTKSRDRASAVANNLVGALGIEPSVP